MLKRFVGFAVCALLLGGVYTWARSAARLEGSGSAQVTSTILAAFQAANMGRVSEAMDAVSSDYKDSTGLNRDRLWLLLHRAADNRQLWDVTARKITPTVDGRDASVELLAAVNIDGEPTQRTYPLTLSMRLEDTHVWGVIPTQRWRVVSVGGLPDELLSLGD
ncbi:MAG TPA: hypothetical protein VGM51_11915 [Armatimonadota bacterium]|jgi:hypothetical protein